MATVPEHPVPPLSPLAGFEYGPKRELLDRLRALHDLLDYAIEGEISLELAVDAVIQFATALRQWERVAA